MKRFGSTPLIGYSLLLMSLAMLAACAPLGTTPSPPPGPALATNTAAASASVRAGGSVGSSATPVAHLPMFTTDPGWVAVVQIPDGSALGGPSAMGGQVDSATAAATLTLGAFTLSSAALVVVMFGCVSPATAHASLEMGLSGGESVKIPCGAVATMNRSQITMPHSAAGTKLTASATISTDSAPPEWNLIVEQPK